jgi:hypothetical protein
LPTALVTGAPDRVPDIAVALKSQGFDILSAGSEPLVGPTGLAPGSVDCYIQLPGEPARFDDTPIGRARAAITDELLARFDAAARLAPLLAPQATVLLVANGAAPEEPNPPESDAQALRALIGVLAEAILADLGVDGVRATVVEEGRRPDEIAVLARGRRTPPVEWSSYVDIEPDLPYCEWRDELMCLSSIND